MKTKILLSSNILWTITQFRLGLIKALVNAGFEVVCVADTDDFSVLSEQKIMDAGARFIRLQTDRKGTNPLKDLCYLNRYRRILKNEKPDLVINYTIKPVIYGSVAARMFNIPSFAVTTGLGFVFITNNLLTRFTRFLYRISLKFPGKVFFLNRDDRDAFLEHHLVDHRKAFILPGEGVDTVFYSPDSERSEDAIFTFLLVTRLLREKGIGEYAEAARLMKKEGLPGARFRLIGYIDANNPGGISREELQQWINEGIIDYGGTTEDVRAEIIASDCFVLPSFYREGVPRTLLEAASMAKPIITTDNVGCREVVDDGVNGFLCEPRNSRDLYEKMIRMMSLPAEERKKMGQAGRQKVLDQFDEKIITDMYLKEIELVLGRSDD